MRTKLLLVLIGILGLTAAAIIIVRPHGRTSQRSPTITFNSGQHSHPSIKTVSKKRVPAYEVAPRAAQLAPTLPPSQFVGKAREAYKVAKEIPETLAQLPCYCHCDQSFGHRSLHTCFVDDHASQCAVCVDEALLAYRLQKEQGLTANQVRELIIEKYSSDH